jgi:hypothetical protein
MVLYARWRKTQIPAENQPPRHPLLLSAHRLGDFLLGPLCFREQPRQLLVVVGVLVRLHGGRLFLDMTLPRLKLLPQAGGETVAVARHGVGSWWPRRRPVPPGSPSKGPVPVAAVFVNDHPDETHTWSFQTNQGANPPGTLSPYGVQTNSSDQGSFYTDLYPDQDGNIWSSSWHLSPPSVYKFPVTFNGNIPQYSYALPLTLQPPGPNPGQDTFLGRILYDAATSELYTCWFTDAYPFVGNTLSLPNLDIGRVVVKYTWNGSEFMQGWQSSPAMPYDNAQMTPKQFYLARSMSVAGAYVFVRMGTDSTGWFGEIRVFRRDDGTELPSRINLDGSNYYAGARNQDVADVTESTQVRFDGGEYRIFTESLSQSETHLIRWTP